MPGRIMLPVEIDLVINPCKNRFTFHLPVIEIFAKSTLFAIRSLKIPEGIGSQIMNSFSKITSFCINYFCVGSSLFVIPFSTVTGFFGYAIIISNERFKIISIRTNNCNCL